MSDEIFETMFNTDTLKRQIELENGWFEEEQMKKKQQVRENFRNVCLERDSYKCKVCSHKPQLDEQLDVHHITDRTEMPNGGYVKENGITLCSGCHIKAERFHITAGKEWTHTMHPDDLYRMIGSSYKRAFEASERL